MSQNEIKDTSSKTCRNINKDDDREGNEEEQLTHEYMESYLDRAQKDIQRLIDRSSSGATNSSSSSSSASSSSVINRPQLNKINELPSSFGNYNDEDSETCGESMWSSTHEQQKDPPTREQSIHTITTTTASLLNDSPDTSSSSSASNKLNKSIIEQSRYATTSPTFDNGNIIRPTSRRTSFNKLASGSKFLSNSRDELYYEHHIIKSGSPTDTCSSKLANKRHYNRLQSPIGGTSSSSNVSTASNKLNEGEILSRRLQSSPIRPNPVMTQQQQQKHLTHNKLNSQIYDSAAARRASLGTNTDQLSSSATNKSKESLSGLPSQEFDKLRLSGSDLHIARSTPSSNRVSSKAGQPILSRTSIGQFANLISGSNQSSSSSAISKANAPSTSNKSSPLRSLSPASSGSGFFGFGRSFLSFDSGHKNDNNNGSSVNLNDRPASIGDQSSKKCSAYSSIKARRSIASPLVFSTSIGGIFSGNKHFQQQSSLTSASSSNASLSVDSIPNIVAKQQDILPEQSSSTITALVTAAVGSRKSFYENVDHDSSVPTDRKMDNLNECDIKGLKAESGAHGRSMSISNDDASSRWPSQNERAKWQQSCTESKLHISTKGHLVPLFGCDINSIELLTKVGLTLPPVIDSAMQHILTNGINSVGIFRKSGVKSRIMNLRQRIESNQGLKFESLEQTEFSIYDVADLIKMWFRELKPSPILTRELIRLISSNIALIKSQKQIISSFSDASTCNTSSSSSSLLSSLPPSSTCKQAFNLRNHYSDLSQRINGLITSTHRAILIRVLKFFSRISSKCETNQMTAQNLAICLTPSLCYTEADQQSILMAQKALEYCINNYECLFMIKPAIYSNQRSNSLIDSSLAARNTETLLEMPNTPPKVD